MNAFISARFTLKNAGNYRSPITYLIILLRLRDKLGFLTWSILLQAYKDLDPNLRVFVPKSTFYIIKNRFVQSLDNMKDF
jgi:hypothetical protein